MAKICGIGFHKTGTTSLGIALEQLGYTVCHGARPLRLALGPRQMIDILRHGPVDPILDVAGRYEAFEDVPWFALYKELDRRFEGSKFILTTRDPLRWLDSARRYFGRTTSPLREWIYGVGSPLGQEQRWLDRYRRHHDDVQAYFRNRPHDLLVVDWERGSGWPELAGFLDRAAPAQPFPHVQPTRSQSRS